MELAVTTLEYNPEWDYEEPYTTIWDEQKIREALHSNRWIRFSLDDELPSEDEVIELLFEEEWVVDVQTVAEQREREEEERRKRLESTAATLARQYQVEVNSNAFLDLLEQLIDQQESYREGMREDRLCIGYGVTPDQWCEEHNASVGDTMQVYELQDWMQENLPLLCARHAEQKRMAPISQ